MALKQVILHKENVLYWNFFYELFVTFWSVVSVWCQSYARRSEGGATQEDSSHFSLTGLMFHMTFWSGLLVLVPLSL